MSKMNSMLKLMTMDVGNIVIAEFCSYNNVRVESDVDSEVGSGGVEGTEGE